MDPLVRRAATRADPLLFALLYFPHHLSDELSGLSLAEAHLEWCRWAVATMTAPRVALREHRDAFVAPRETGKSTWHFLILPAWAAAHEWSTFAVAFADTVGQAREHLETFRAELRVNDLLRTDWPDLCHPELRPDRSVAVADRQDLLRQRSGFVFAARGADKGVLGLKVGNRRPDYLILDDIEPGESQYSTYQAGQRLTTLSDVILPLNLAARVVLSGTVTMPGSIVHQLVAHELGELTADEEERAAWIGDEQWTVHYHPPILTAGDGTERSQWPERWTLEWLRSIRHTRSYRKNMENRPLAGDGDWWTPEDFTYRQLPHYGATVLSIDPATTTKSTSDWTGLAVVSRAPKPSRELHVRYATHVRLTGRRLRQRVEALLAEFPDVRVILMEDNQGGDYVADAVEGLGPRVHRVTQHEPKEVRVERTLDLYQRRPARVFHAERFATLEAEAEGFGARGLNDDTLDATCTGLLFLARPARKATRRRSVTYTG